MHCGNSNKHSHNDGCVFWSNVGFNVRPKGMQHTERGSNQQSSHLVIALKVQSISGGKVAPFNTQKSGKLIEQDALLQTKLPSCM